MTIGPLCVENIANDQTTLICNYTKIKKVKHLQKTPQHYVETIKTNSVHSKNKNSKELLFLKCMPG